MKKQKKRTKKKGSGGTRSGSGRKKMYDEPTEVLSFRVPVSKTEPVKEAVKKVIND